VLIDNERVPGGQQGRGSAVTMTVSSMSDTTPNVVSGSTTKGQSHCGVGAF
jgi:hypothetical protein